MTFWEGMLWVFGLIIFSFQLYISKNQRNLFARLNIISSKLDAYKNISDDTQHLIGQLNILVVRVLEERQRREEQEEHLLKAIEKLRRERDE